MRFLHFFHAAHIFLKARFPVDTRRSQPYHSIMKRVLCSLALLAIALLWLFPPFVATSNHDLPTIPLGHAFICSHPRAYHAVAFDHKLHIDVDTLITETCTVVIVSAALYCGLGFLPRSKKTRLPPGHVMRGYSVN